MILGTIYALLKYDKAREPERANKASPLSTWRLEKTYRQDNKTTNSRDFDFSIIKPRITTGNRISITDERMNKIEKEHNFGRKCDKT